MRKLNYPLLTALLSALLLLLFTVQDVDAQTNCQVEPCAPLTTGNGPDPCLAKLYCSNSGSVPNGLVACTPAADTDGCGIDASISAQPLAPLDTWLKSKLPNSCYATGNHVQWLKYWLPLGVNSVKIQGVGSSLKAWAVFHVPGDYTVGSYGVNSTPCTTSNLVYYGACSNMNQWMTITNPGSDPFDENMYLIALIYNAPTNGTINFKTKDCEAICYPYIDCPNAATFECSNAAGIQAWLASYTAISCNLNNTSVTNNYSPNLFTGCNGTGTAEITFTLKRNNTVLATCKASLTIVDTTKPTITCPTPATTIVCPATPVWGNATATDNCGTPTITFTTTQTNGCGGTYSQTRTWTATDACGNSEPCSVTIYVVDNTPPTITCPGPVTVQCISLVPAANPALVNASDACGSVTVVFESDVTTSGSCVNRATIQRTYRASDGCNSSPCTQLITVFDNTPPTFTNCPPAAEVACFVSTHPSNTGYATATDNCGGNVTVTWADNAPANCGQNPGPFTRTWTATDACGNSTSNCTQLITCGYCGCTLTQGYWKTHSEFGPAPYDANWANLPNGASTPFYLSGQSWYDVFHTAPAGNNYYILAHQFMAASLNYLNGASYPPAVATIMANAAAAFSANTPANFNANVPNAISWANTLDQYNNGLLGVPHCGYSSGDQALEEALSQALQVTATPNPFAGQVQFSFSVPYDSPVVFDLFDAKGRKVTTLFSGYLEAGQARTIEFDAANMPQGLYIYRLTTDREVRAGQVVSIK